MNKVLITGTGRCGTTFLIKLFTFLGLDTGYTKANYRKSVFNNCNSGMERSHKEKYTYLKNPTFLINMKDILSLYEKDLLVIIPIRSYEISSKSRLKHGLNNGGLWNAKNLDEQINFYHKSIANYMLDVVKYDIDTIFLDFERMVCDKHYLFERLSRIMQFENISFDVFSTEYDNSSKTC